MEHMPNAALLYRTYMDTRGPQGIGLARIVLSKWAVGPFQEDVYDVYRFNPYPQEDGSQWLYMGTERRRNDILTPEVVNEYLQLQAQQQ